MVSSTNKSNRHDITEILLKVALNIITLTSNPIVQFEVCKLGQVFEPLVILVDMLDKDCTSFKTLSILDKSRLPYNSYIHFCMLNKIFAYRLNVIK